MQRLRRISSNTNFTVAFFSNEDSTSCDSADTSKGIVLTTRTVPASFTCFNVSDVFSQSNITGFANSSTPIYPEDRDHPNGVDWFISNLDNYDSNANYTNMWYEQNGANGKIEEGVNGRWVLWTYQFEDCQQLGEEPFDYSKNPWFETSCQTKDGGQCRTVPDSIKSFALNLPGGYNKGHESCETWGYMGNARRSEAWSVRLVAAWMGATMILFP